MDNRYEIAEQNGMSLEFADWFFDNKKDGCGNAWFVMMAAMWEGCKGRAEPPAPDKIALAIENLKQKLVECNRYNYCADAVKGVEDACRLLALQNQNMSAPITPEAIENAIEYIRSIAFHIDEDDYHGKHIAYFMRQALAWLEGHSCSDGRQGKADNQPASGNQAAESNRGNEWTGNPDIDNAIIMLDRIDTAESCDDDRIEAVKAVLRRLAGNSPVTPGGWISCSERMPEKHQNVLISVNFDSSLVEPLICSARYT